MATNKLCRYPDGAATKFIVSKYQKPQKHVLTKYDPVHIGKVDLVCRLNSIENQLGVSLFELSILENFARKGEKYIHSGHKQQTYVWEVVLPELILLLELVRAGVYAFLGMEIVSEKCPHLLLDPETIPSPDCLVRLNQFSHASFGSLINRIGGLMSQLTTRTISLPSLVELLVASTLMLSVIEYKQMLPLVDFGPNRHDYLLVLLGYLNTKLMSRPFFEGTPVFSLHYSPLILETALYTIPLIQRYFHELRHLQQDEATQLTQLFGYFNDLLIMCAKSKLEMPFHVVFRRYGKDFFHLVYEKDILGLTLLNFIAVISLMFKNYYNQHQNMYIDYMRWYHKHNLEEYGGFKFAVDKAWYSLMVEKKIEPPGLIGLLNFDPVLVDSLT